MKNVILGFLVVLLAGCASTRQYVAFPDQTKAIADYTKGRIYVARPAVIGGAVPMKVTDGSTLIGKTGPAGYLCWERPAGRVQIKGQAENTSTLSLNVERGKVYYIEQDVRMGVVMARNRLIQLAPASGQDVLRQCKPPKLVQK